MYRQVVDIQTREIREKSTVSRIDRKGVNVIENNYDTL